MESQNTLTKESIPKLIKQIAVPASVGFFFNTMFNIVDTYWGGMVSTQALAALSLSFPVFFIIIAFGTGFSTGTTALIANALGAEKKEEAGALAAQGISFSILLSIILTIVGLLLSPKLFILLGAEGEYLSLSLQYMNVIFYGTLFFMLVYALNAVLNALGDTKTFRNFLIAGFFLNLLLDPWFMFGWLGFPALGLPGVAYATIFIQLLGCIYMSYRVAKVHLISGKTLKDFLPTLSVYKEIARQSIPASLNMVTVGLGIFIITYFISQFGEVVVAAYGIATRVEQIFLLPTIGISIATLTLIGQANGAGDMSRVQEILRVCLRYGAYIMTVGTIMIFLFARPLMDFFTNDGAVIDAGTTYLRIAAFLTWAYAIMFTNVSALQGMKRPMFALWIGLGRQIVGPLIVFTIFAHYFGSLGIWWGIALVNWSAALVTIFYVRKVFARLR